LRGCRARAGAKVNIFFHSGVNLRFCRAFFPAVTRIMEPQGTRVYGMEGFATLEAPPSACTASDLPQVNRLDDTLSRELDRFLEGVERRAFRIAELALRDRDDAHDAVQVAMLSLVQHYAGRPPAEWRPLFYRILYNGIRDAQRRKGVRRRFFAVLPGGPRHDDDAEVDPLEQVPDPGGDPSEHLVASATLANLEVALRRLPARQLEAFALRCLEGLDVASAAAAMGCSEGSVKTHYFRALQSLRAQLDEVRA
jgi:RNA polymerase sigma-70 factor (ECF subfamily)